MSRPPPTLTSGHESRAPVTYAEAGVDIDAGDSLVERIKPLARMTRIAEVLEDVGGFAGLCRVPGDIDEPVLVSGTDGVGTKLKVAFATGKHDTIGQDLVAMCVNDVLTCGARPLFFLDYFATGKLDVDVAESVVRGIANACKISGCALLGGETAELPQMYAAGEYDLAGFAVGVVGRKSLVDGKKVVAGDKVLGLASSGLHSNGYALARRVLTPAAPGHGHSHGAFAERPAELGGASIGETLLEPTRLYAPAVKAALAAGLDVRAMCHVTGGGLPGNLPRVLPEGLGIELAPSWPRPPVFDLIAQRGPVEEAEMRRTFNLGVGYVFVVPEGELDRLTAIMSEAGFPSFPLGTVIGVDPQTPFEERVLWGPSGASGGSGASGASGAP